MPTVDEVLPKLSKATLDAEDEFHQVKIYNE